MTQTFDPGRHSPGQPVFEDVDTAPESNANFAEQNDAAGNSSTTYSISAGETFAGTIGSNTDTDWIQITFTEGNVYTIDAFGNGNTSTSGFDTDLRIFDANGTQLAYNDASGAGFDAQITFTPSTSGTYFIEVSSFNTSNSTGAYTLQVLAETAPPPPPPPGSEGTVAQLAQYLKGGDSGVERTFDTSSSNEITVNLGGLTTEGQQLARWAMEAWEMVADIQFTEVSSGEMITLDDEDSGAFAYFPNTGSTSAGVELNVSTNWLSTYGTSIDSYSFQTYIHEFGHALGLYHQGNYNFTGTPITYEDYAYFSNDSWQMSIMSYFSQTQNTSINASYALVMGAQMADIAAIQDFYGAAGAGSATAGATVYGQGSTLGNYVDEVFAAWGGTTSSNIGGSRTAFTIYDAGGEDTLDLSYLSASRDLRIDLNGGSFSDLGTSWIGVLGISEGTVLERLVTGGGDDTITGNAAANVIDAGAGDDRIDAGAGDDTITGGAGNDTIEGGAGEDLLIGGGQNDVLTGGADDDVFVFAAASGEITDYAFDTLDLTDGTVSGDLIVLENSTSHQVTVSGGFVLVDGIQVQSTAATGNIAVVASSGSVFGASTPATPLAVPESILAGQTLTLHDAGTEEAFDRIEVVYGATGAVLSTNILYDDQTALYTQFDALNENSWDVIEDQFNASGALEERLATYDTGDQLRTLFDVDNVETWQSVFEFRTASGQLYDERFNYDSGEQLRIVYNIEGSASWSSVYEYRNIDNAVYDRRTNYDDGTQYRIVFDVENDADWDTVQEYRTASGDVFDRRTNQDDGSQTRVLFDTDGTESWDTVFLYTNAADELFQFVYNFDNGNVQAVRYDVEDAFDWDSYSLVVDAFGTVLSETFV